MPPATSTDPGNGMPVLVARVGPDGLGVGGRRTDTDPCAEGHLPWSPKAACTSSLLLALLDRIQARGPGTDEGVTFRLRPRPMRGTRSMAIADMQFCLSVLFMGVTSTEPWEERRSRLHQAPKRLEW